MSNQKKSLRDKLRRQDSSAFGNLLASVYGLGTDQEADTENGTVSSVETTPPTPPADTQGVERTEAVSPVDTAIPEGGDVALMDGAVLQSETTLFSEPVAQIGPVTSTAATSHNGSTMSCDTDIVLETDTLQRAVASHETVIQTGTAFSTVPVSSDDTVLPLPVDTEAVPFCKTIPPEKTVPSNGMEPAAAVFPAEPAATVSFGDADSPVTSDLLVGADLSERTAPTTVTDTPAILASPGSTAPVDKTVSLPRERGAETASPDTSYSPPVLQHETDSAIVAATQKPMASASVADTYSDAGSTPDSVSPDEFRDESDLTPVSGLIFDTVTPVATDSHDASALKEKPVSANTTTSEPVGVVPVLPNVRALETGVTRRGGDPNQWTPRDIGAENRSRFLGWLALRYVDRSAMRFRLLCHLIQENPSTVMSFSYRGLRDATGMSTASIRDACVKLEEEGLVRISRPTKGGVFLDIEKLYERFEAGG